MTPEVALILSTLITASVSILGYIQLQSKQKQIETLRSGLDRKLHIRKLTFEREFRILSKLWGSFVGLRRSADDLYWSVSPLYMNTTDEATKQQQTQLFVRFEEHQSEFLGVFEKNRPFYPQEIHDMLVDFVQATNIRESTFKSIVSNPNSDHSAALKQAFESRQKMLALGESLCKAIRRQIQTT